MPGAALWVVFGMQGPKIDEYARETTPEPRTLARFLEETSGVSLNSVSVSSSSDGSEYESMPRTHVRSLSNFSSRRSFVSKPVYPLSFPDYTAEGDETCGTVSTTNFHDTLHSYLKSMQALMVLCSLGLLDLGATSQRDPAQWSSASSVDFTDVSEPLEPECLGLPCESLYEVSKCGLCERFLSRRSPWGSRRIVRSGNMLIVGVLSCWHV